MNHCVVVGFTMEPVNFRENATFVRPAYFIIISVLGNTTVMAVICLDHNLRTPKYVAVFNLALVDLIGSSALVPKVFDIFLLIAIVLPLHYPRSIVTKPAITAMLLFVWVVLLIVTSCLVGLLDRLSFCGSLVIQSFYCDHGPTYRLACNDTFLNKIMIYVTLTIIDYIPLILIALTYICIAIALSRIASHKERVKALKTCTSHLILVAIFFLPFLGTNIAAMTSYLHPNARIINSTLTHTIPAFVNPIIYSLKSEEVLDSFKKLCKNKSCRRCCRVWIKYPLSCFKYSR
uniref:G-protein coupled receptors family 1 profile domain-containing protein n=1 Tax=Mastacembelus armatus TaxID=205130 RepID=A0A3Q3SQH9_9TELE